MSSLKYWVWLSTCKGIGLIRTKELLEHFGTPENIFHAGRRDFLDISGIRQKEVEQLMSKDMSHVNEILTACNVTGCRMITLFDSQYPDRLRNIYDPPPVLYVKGNLPYIDEEPVVGVVGTRKCTPYGLTVAENVGYALSQKGVIVVTGLALGVDTAATCGALKGGTPTVGIIGSGLDIVYPPENKRFFADVAGAGAIISEYPPGTPPKRAHFPSRNRLISGISLGVAVIESPRKSGALITAARALEQGRDVFALPGNVDAVSCEGSNALLREGAIPFMSAADIIDEYSELYPDRLQVIKAASSKKNKRIKDGELKKPIDNTPKVDYIGLVNLLGKLDGDEQNIARSIGLNSLSVDEIILDTGFPAQKVLAGLTMLELGGYIKYSENKKWEISNPLISQKM